MVISLYSLEISTLTSHTTTNPPQQILPNKPVRARPSPVQFDKNILVFHQMKEFLFGLTKCSQDGCPQICRGASEEEAVGSYAVSAARPLLGGTFHSRASESMRIGWQRNTRQASNGRWFSKLYSATRQWKGNWRSPRRRPTTLATIHYMSFVATVRYRDVVLLEISLAVAKRSVRRLVSQNTKLISQ